jgi:hypothetical protein
VRVEVDVSEVAALRARAERELSGRSVARVMDVPLQRAAQAERVTHAYQNRTTRLEQSTVAVPDAIAATEVRLSLQMIMSYAEFVWRRGLSGLDGYAAIADGQIRQAFSDQAKRIAG